MNNAQSTYTLADNIQYLLDGGYIKQANRMANSESISVEYDPVVDNPTIYHFPDGSTIAIEVTL